MFVISARTPPAEPSTTRLSGGTSAAVYHAHRHPARHHHPAHPSVSEDPYDPTGVPTVDNDSRVLAGNPRPRHRRKNIIQRRPAESGTVVVGAVVLLLGRVFDWDGEVQSSVSLLVLAAPALISNTVDRLRNSS